MSEQPEVGAESVDDDSSPAPKTSPPDFLAETLPCIESDTDTNVDAQAVAQQGAISDQRTDADSESATLDSAATANPHLPTDAKSDSPSRVDSSPKIRKPELAEVPPLPVAAPTAPTTPASRAQNIRFTDDLLTECEETIGYKFKNRAMLEQSLTHASISKTRLASNERLEFLGDSIMGAVVCEFLFKEFPEYPEGELTRIKSSVVSRHTCSKVSAELNFGRFLALGKGLAVHDRIPTSILAAAFESVIAGIYLDGGWEPAGRFIISALRAEIKQVSRSAHGYNFKSLLQQSAQKTMGATPVYKLLAEKGPDHSKNFQISAAIGARLFAAAWGASKKEAEQNAARNALEELKAQKEPKPAAADSSTP
jgi:ribonuclease-3